MRNNYEIRGDTIVIFIESPKHGHFEVLIDTEDVPKIENYRWCVKYYPRDKVFYIVANTTIKNKRKMLKMHRLITNCPDQMVVDHTNHNTLDNRKQNLRVCTDKQNKENIIRAKSHNKSSGLRGIYWDKQRKKWKVKLVNNGKQIYGGFYSDIEIAKIKVKELRDKYFTHSLI